MKNTLSHSFIFQIDSDLASNGRYQNIIHLTDEDNSKYFVQYIQYDENDNTSINLRHMNIKVDNDIKI